MRNEFDHPIRPAIVESPDEDDLTPFDGEAFAETVTRSKAEPRSKSIEYDTEYAEASE